MNNWAILSEISNGCRLKRYADKYFFLNSHCLTVLEFNDTPTLVGRLPEKGRKKIEEIVEEIKEREGKKEEQE